MAGSDVTMILGGDLHVQRPEPESMFVHIVSYLREADILFGNLEMLPTSVGPESAAWGNGSVHSEERMLSAYTYAGFHAVGLANNHAMDSGPTALLRCIELLDGAGIAHAGGGRDLPEARKPAIVERNGTRVAFLSYTSVFLAHYAATANRAGLATVRVSTTFEPQVRHVEVPGSPPIIRTHADPRDAAAMVEDVRAAKEQADVVVVSWHWGLSPNTGGTAQLVGYETDMAHAAIDAGADLVVGHHPHMLEAVEVYKGKHVFYSLGNFGFDFFAGRKFAMERNSFVLVRCLIRDRAIQEVSFIPMRIPDDAPQPILLSLTEGADIVQRVRDLSEPFGTRFQVGEREVRVETQEAVAVG